LGYLWETVILKKVGGRIILKCISRNRVGRHGLC
jgi:hypothetical protein